MKRAGWLAPFFTGGRDDTDRQADPGDNGRAGTVDPPGDHARIHTLTQTLRNAGLDPGQGACPCAACAEPPLVVVASDGGVVQGWRCYTAMLGPDWEPLLCGATGKPWIDRRMEAKCPYGGGDVGFAAGHIRASICNCGIYLLKADPRPPPMWQARYANAGPSFHMAAMPVWAFCVAYGTVLEASDGYRATHVRIEQLWAEGPTWLSRELRERYGVPVHGLGDER